MDGCYGNLTTGALTTNFDSPRSQHSSSSGSHTIPRVRVTINQMMKYSVKGALFGTPVVMFTQYSGEPLHDFVLRVASSPRPPPSPTPWIPPVIVGPVYLGSFVNFVLAIVSLGCFCASVVLMWQYLTVVSWQDRYDHGYQLHPSLWNFAVTAPFVILAWMLATDVSAVTIGPVALSETIVVIGVFVLPTLGGAYLLR